jgi:Na+/alanine symporter
MVLAYLLCAAIILYGHAADTPTLLGLIVPDAFRGDYVQAATGGTLGAVISRQSERLPVRRAAP